MDWTAIKGIPTKDERDAVALALYHAGYEVRIMRGKPQKGNAVFFVEYREQVNDG